MEVVSDKRKDIERCELLPGPVYLMLKSQNHEYLESLRQKYDVIFFFQLILCCFLFTVKVKHRFTVTLKFRDIFPQNGKLTN